MTNLKTSRRGLWSLGAATAALVAVGMSRTALAERHPTPEERTQIETALRALGYVSWGDIELDDGVWEVDDARLPNGEEYDVKLRPGTLEVISRQRD